MKIAIIGCGGTGSHLLPLLLRLAPKASYTLFDRDSFTVENLDRQVFDARDVGTNKALALSQLYRGHSIEPVPEFVDSRTDLSGFDALFACPDNNPARRVALGASVRHGFPAYICGNEYESASAFVFQPEWVDVPDLDPRLRYPDLLSDSSGDPLHVSCTGEAAEASPQLALANASSAAFAAQLFHIWNKVAADPEPFADIEVRRHLPVEFNWVPSKVSTLSVGNLLK